MKQCARHDFPSYAADISRLDLILVSESFNFHCVVKTPKRGGDFSTPGSLFEKKLGHSSHEVELKVLHRKSAMNVNV